MNAAQLERAAITPYLFVQKLLSPNPYSLRERAIDFSPPLTSGAVNNSGVDILDILPGGRFVLAHTRQMIVLYDMGPSRSSFDGQYPRILASKAIGHDGHELCYISLDNSTYLCCFHASLWETA